MAKGSDTMLKRQRQSEKKRIANAGVKSKMRTAAKAAIKAIEDGQAGEAQALVKKAVSLMSRTSVKGVIHKKNVSRHISRLMKSYNAKFGKPAAAQPAAPAK